MEFGKKLNVDDCFNLISTSFNSDSSIIEKPISKLDIDTTKKTIISLCGNNTKNPMRGFSYAHHCINWLNNSQYQQVTDVHAIFYPHEQPLLETLTPNPQFNYTELANIIFNQLIKSDKTTLTTNEIINNFENIIFFGHSMGGFIMNELMNKLNSILKNNGFSKNQIDKIYKSIVFIGYSPYCLVDAPINKIFITPIYDSLGSTKLAFDIMNKQNSISSTQPNLNINEVCKLREKSHPSFIKHYNNLTSNEDVSYFTFDNTLIATPNLLYYDGIKEDHNLAGVVNYKTQSPYKTKAGCIMTEFMNETFSYAFEAQRDKNFINNLYNHSVQTLEKNKNEELQ